MSDSVVSFIIALCAILLGNRAILVIPENDPILTNSSFCSHFYGDCPIHPTLLNGDRICSEATGVIHVMKMRGPRDYTEMITSLAATGASLIVHYSDIPIVYPGHPFVPVFRIARKSSVNADGLVSETVDSVMKRITSILSREEETIVGIVFACNWIGNETALYRFPNCAYCIRILIITVV